METLTIVLIGIICLLLLALGGVLIWKFTRPEKKCETCPECKLNFSKYPSYNIVPAGPKIN